LPPSQPKRSGPTLCIFAQAQAAAWSIGEQEQAASEADRLQVLQTPLATVVLSYYVLLR
jgi:hypothetical protein